MYKYIGVVGYAGSGKDTFAEIFRKYHPRYEVFKFAGKLKEFCSKLFDIPLEVFEDQELKKAVGIYKFVSHSSYIEHFHATSRDVLGIDKDLQNAFLAFAAVKVIGAYSALEGGELVFKTTPREILQKIGTDVFRNHYSDAIWVDTIDVMDMAIVTDVRFPNEADKIKESGGILVRIINESQESDTPMNHPSEQHISEIDCGVVIVNDGKSLEKLERAVKEFCTLLEIQSIFEEKNNQNF